MIDFDDIDAWAPSLAAALRPHVPDSAAAQLVAAAPEYVEDARDGLLSLAGRDQVIHATLDWIRSLPVAAYHGSRLTAAEVASIRTVGLTPLRAETRLVRLKRALAPHPRWKEVEGKLDAAIQAHGRGSGAGSREGQVHLTLSRAGLTDGFNHYLTHGAEFDQHVAHALLGEDGVNLLARDGEPRVVQVAVPGPAALDAAHPHFSVDHLRARGEVPNLVRQFIEAWSYRLVHPGFQSRTLKVDCGMVFRSTVPSAWVTRIDTLAG
jgi:hypothetical protein